MRINGAGTTLLLSIRTRSWSEIVTSTQSSALPFCTRVARGVRFATLILASCVLCLPALPSNAQAQSKGLVTIYSQVVNASPDSTLGLVDFYGDDSRLVDGMGQYEAAPFFTLLTGNTHEIVVTADNSTDTSQWLLKTSLPVTDGMSLTAAIVGVKDPEVGHNPNGVDVSLALAIRDDAQRQNLKTNTLLVSVLHAAPRARSLWVSAGPEQTLIADSLRFGEFSDYVEVPIDSTAEYFYFYEAEFGPDANCSGDIVSFYNGCLQIALIDLLPVGNVFTLVIQEMDPNGYSLLAATAVFPNGVVVPIRYYTSVGVEEVSHDATAAPFMLSVFPLPATDFVTIQVPAANPSIATVQITDLTGRLVRTESLGVLSGGENPVEVDVRDLADGVYFCRVTLIEPTRAQVKLGRIVVAR